MALTDTAIKALAPKDKRYKAYDSNGLHLEVQPSGTKVWRLRYRIDGKEKRGTFGHYPNISLKEAREKTNEAIKQIAMGEDPFEKAKIAPLAGQSFQAVAEDWIVKQKPRWSEEHATTVGTRLAKYAYPHIGTSLINEITPPDVLRFVRMIEGRGKNETASRVLGICSQVFRYGVACGLCASDPCRDLRGALVAHVEVPRPALTNPSDVAELMRSMRDYQGSIVTRLALFWSAYTFCRPGEVRRAEWSEIEWDKKEWRIPAAKMKMRFEHRVPLSRQCIEVLQDLRERKLSDVWIFPGPRPSRPLSENGVLSALRRMGYEKHEMTAHGFRAMASTLLNELGYRPDLIEKQLAHGDTDKVRAVYNRAAYMEERRLMMQAWADYLDGLADGKQSPLVLPDTP